MNQTLQRIVYLLNVGFGTNDFPRRSSPASVPGGTIHPLIRRRGRSKTFRFCVIDAHNMCLSECAGEPKPLNARGRWGFRRTGGLVWIWQQPPKLQAGGSNPLLFAITFTQTSFWQNRSDSVRMMIKVAKFRVGPHRPNPLGWVQTRHLSSSNVGTDGSTT